MPKPLPPDHPTFGPCFVVRRRGLGDWGLMLIFSSLLVFFAAMAISTGIREVLKGDPSAWLVILLGLGLLLPIVPCFLYLLTRFEFYQQGAINRRPGKAREFPFAGATSLTYTLTRQYYNGIYVGTAQKLVFKTADNRRFRFAGTHKEKAEGPLVIGSGQVFEGEDELDTVRSIIAAEIAARALQDVLAGTPFNWCKQVELTTDGIRPLRGKRKNTLVPWSEIHGISADKGAYHIFAKGDKRSFADFAMNAPNFHPGLELFSTLLTPHLPQDPSTAESTPPTGES